MTPNACMAQYLATSRFGDLLRVRHLGKLMRTVAQIIWFLVTFLSLLGLTTLAMASFLQGTFTPEQFGYEVGRKAIWLLVASFVIVALASRRGWLPGVSSRSSGHGPSA